MKYANIKPEKLLMLRFEKKKRCGYFGNFIWKFNGIIDDSSTDDTMYSFDFIDRYTGNKLHRLYMENKYNKGRTVEEMAKLMIHVMKTGLEWGEIGSMLSDS